MKKINNWSNRDVKEFEDEAWQKSYFKEIEKRQKNEKNTTPGKPPTYKGHEFTKTTI